MTRTILTALILPAPLLLCACAGPLNNESGIGNAGGKTAWAPATLAQSSLRTTPEGFEPTTDQQAAPIYTADGPVSAADSQPSVQTVDRSNWGAIPVVVPNTLPAHQPRFTWSYLRNHSPRARGEFPNERTALNMGSEKGNREQVVEALAAPFVAASDIILYLPRAIMESRPYQPTRTGSWPYQRQPRNDQLRPESLTPVEPPAPPAPAQEPATPEAQPR